MEDILNINDSKQRHGCVTTWLLWLVAANAVSAIFYLTRVDYIVQNSLGLISKSTIYLLALCGVANAIFALLLFQWKKIGFWGFLISGLIIFYIKLNIGIDFTRSLIGLSGIVILFVVLQLKKNQISAWKNLE